MADKKIADKQIANTAKAAAPKKLGGAHKVATVHKLASGANKGKTVASKKPATGRVVM